jgi:hypothetical protein
VPYKYNPRDFSDMGTLPFEIDDFYSLLEVYHADKSSMNLTCLDKQRTDLFFSIKHRVVEGSLTKSQAQEMRDYFGELFDGE